MINILYHNHYWDVLLMNFVSFKYFFYHKDKDAFTMLVGSYLASSTKNCVKGFIYILLKDFV